MYRYDGSRLILIHSLNCGLIEREAQCYLHTSDEVVVWLKLVPCSPLWTGLGTEVEWRGDW